MHADCLGQAMETERSLTSFFCLEGHSQRIVIAPLMETNVAIRHERLTDLAVVPREKPHTGAAAREQPRDSPVIQR